MLSEELSSVKSVNATTIRSPKRRKVGDMLHSLGEPLRYGNFRLLFIGQFISLFGDAFYAVALPWLILNSNNPQSLSIVLAVYGLPRVVTVLIGGWLSDRMQPRLLMLVADVFRVVTLATLTFAVIVGFTPLWLLCVILALTGAASGLFIPASWAITPDLLPNEVLSAGNSLNFGWSQLANLIGPSVAGILISMFPIWVALVIDAGTFLVSALTLFLIIPLPHRTVRISIGDKTTKTTSIIEFGRYLWSTPAFLVILVVSLVVNLIIGGVLEVGLPTLAHGPLHAGANGYGYMLGGFGVGALIGSLSANHFLKLPRPGLINLIIWVIFGVALTTVSITNSLSNSISVLVIVGLASGLGNVGIFSVIQQLLPRQYLGRYMGALAFANFGLYPVSVALVGWLIQFNGPANIIAYAGTLATITFLVALTLPAVRQLSL